MITTLKFIRRLFLPFVFSCLIILPTSPFTFAADGIKVLANQRIIVDEEEHRRMHIRVFCVSGYKFFQTVGPGWGDGSNPVVSTVQIYEENKGKALPAKCK